MKTHISSKSTLGSNSTKSSHNRFSLSFQMNILKEIPDNSTSQFFVKFQKIFPHKYSFLPPQKNLEAFIYKNFKGTYSNDKNFYNVKVINEIICNETTHIVAEFKDYLIIGDYSEFLQKYYNKKDIIDSLPKIFDYYENCSVIFPNYIILPESKYLYKNIQKKQRIIDQQQELEEEKEKKIERKNINNFAFNTIDDEDIVFNDKAIDSILNQTDTSGVKQFFGLNNDIDSSNTFNMDNVVKMIDNAEKEKIKKINALYKNKNNLNNNIIIKNNINNNNIEKLKDEKTILIYGPPESGKTSFIIRYFENKFDSCYIPSFSDEITKKRCFLNYGKKFNLEIIVSNNLNKIQNADCYFIFFDISSKISFEEAKKIINNIINTNKIIFLIGNKKDLKNVVLEKNIHDLCKKYNLEYFLISVKDNIGISAMMKKFGEIFDYEE
jgi:GTPase SAR1 family protein